VPLRPEKLLAERDLLRADGIVVGDPRSLLLEAERQPPREIRGVGRGHEQPEGQDDDDDHGVVVVPSMSREPDARCRKSGGTSFPAFV
jgi:hypothetical protein